MLYLYAIAAELGDIAALRGVQGEPLVTLPFRDAVVIAGEVAAVPALDAAVLKAQDGLVRTLHSRAAALLPMRFGMTIADAESLTRSLDGRVIDRLAVVRGCDQMTLRVVGASAPSAPPAPPAPSAPSGTAYLLARARSHKSSRELNAIATAAGALQRGVRIEAAQQPGVHGSVYHLIERGHAEDYRRMIEEAAATLPGVHVVITGPSPAYAFA
jgi:hypothetical protein